MNKKIEKTTIKIKKIRDNQLLEKMDEVALEQQVRIPLCGGRELLVSCTPTHVEELILGRRYLLRKLPNQEFPNYESSVLEFSQQKVNSLSKEVEKQLTAVTTKEIFQIARDSFENPGSLFTDTGCAHSCALVHNGKVVCCMEDIGRHNALDKVVGYALLNKIPFEQCYVFTSGRISADYLQKAMAAGFLMVVSRAAVTANAVELAKENNVTLLGFIRKNGGNLYWEGKVKIL